MHGTATQWLPVICQGMGGIGVDEIMPLVSYAVARRFGAHCTSHRTPQLTVRLPKYNGPAVAPRRSHRSPATWALALALALAAIPAAGHAQRVTGPWEDATIAPRGVLRLGISPRWEQWRERYSPAGTREALGSDLSVDSLGASAIPFLAGLQPSLATLTGLAAPPLTLGSLATSVDVTQVTTPITLDYGVTTRLGLQVVIPYVKNRVHVSATMHPDGLNATLGFNPAISIAGAQQQNGLVVTSLGTAATTLSTELARCAGITDPGCSAINADRAGATALVDLAGQVADAVIAVYGTQVAPGSLYAPVAGSALHTAVDARLAALNTQFVSFLGAPTAGDWVSGRPVPAPPMAAADLAALLSSSAYGISAHPLGDYEHSHVGDIEVGAKLLLLDTFGPPATAPLPRAGALRLAVAGVLRLPTGQLDLPEDFTDVGTGDRQTDIELRGFADLAIGPRFWTSAVVRIGVQRPHQLTIRIPAPGAAFPELVREQEVRHDPGDVMELELAPRYVPNDEFAFSARYRLRTRAADSFQGTFSVAGADGTLLALDASTLGIGSAQTEHLGGFAVTFSTVRGHARGSARWPLEISFVHTQVLSGKGVPRIAANGLSFRIYR